MVVSVSQRRQPIDSPCVLCKVALADHYRRAWYSVCEAPHFIPVKTPEARAAT